MRAAVIGYGSVGKATAKFFEIEDWIDKDRATISYEKASELDWVFLCVPTPTQNGHCDLAEVKSAVHQLAEFEGRPVIVIRSTVIPGTAEILMRTYPFEILSNPCFGSERSIIRDEHEPSMIVIGSRDRDDRLSVELATAYQKRLPVFFSVPVFLRDNTTAEFIKYALNILFSTKVVWANEMARVCERLNIDYSSIEMALYAHPWVGKNHLKARGRDEQGYYAGGRCLPKDLEAFANFSRSRLLERVLEINKGTEMR